MSTRSGTAKMISPTVAEPDLLLASRMVEARLRMADLLALHLVDVEFEAGGQTDDVGACQIGIAQDQSFICSRRNCRERRVSHDELDDLFGQSGLKSRSEEHTSELQSLMRISYAVFCLKKNNTT